MNEDQTTILTIYAGPQVDPADVLALIEAINKAIVEIGLEPLEVCETRMTLDEYRKETG